ncbi:MAG TPA: N-acetyltransferase [Candidatus Aminicenantes bacterium]|nr:N-acetyltransferase [Candidatus Aminicenantes bacterium]
MKLETKRLLLRTVNQEDVDEVARMWKMEQGPVSREEALEAIHWMETARAKNEPGNLHHLCLAMIIKGTEEIIGWCGLDGRQKERVDIFYLIDSQHRSNGYATECAQALLEHGFSEMEIAQINGRCFKTNRASQRVLEKCGFEVSSEDEETLDYAMTQDQFIRRTSP